MYDNEISSLEYKGYTIKIYQDLDWDCHNPREWDNLGHMICGHHKYEFGDEQIRPQDYESWDQVEKELLVNDPDIVFWRPLYVYEHSGVTINTRPYSCGWDSGQVGFIYLDAVAFSEFETIEDAAECLIQEVKTYAAYLEGDVVYYVVENKEGEVIDSCGGFLGEEEEYVLSQGKDSVEYNIELEEKEKREARRWAERDVVTV